MAGYAIQTRIDGVRPRLSVLDGPADGRRAPIGWSTSAADRGFEDALTGLAVDAQRTPSERWQRVRQSWAQTTFFLFDPNSWR